MEEIFVPVCNFKDAEIYSEFYHISHFGNLKILPRQILGGVKNMKIAIGLDNGRGYLKVFLSNKKHKKMMRIHRLVAYAFVPNPNNYPEINHIDGNKSNNHVSNLEWCTRQQNMIHAYATKAKKGMKHHRFGIKLSEEHKRKMSEALKGKYNAGCRKPKPTLRKPIICLNTGKHYESLTSAANELNLRIVKLSDVLNGRRKHTKGYKFQYVNKNEENK
jgi:hypothetical protein